MASTHPLPTVTPQQRSRGLVPAAYAALVTNVGIVVTGGVVRVSGSGLGCAEWPRCEPGSFTPSVGVLEDAHAAIEFGNRLLTFVVLASVMWLLLEVRRSGALPPLVRRSAVLLVLGVIAQALIGGVTVLTGLQWMTVSVHFLVSMGLIALAVTAVHALRSDPAMPPASVGLRHAATAIATIAFLVLVLGTLVTAAGPHGGDADAPRIALDIRILAIAHAHGVWMLLGTTIVTLLVARQAGVPALVRALAVLLAVSLAQGGVGYLQYWLGIPAELVSLHILGAALVWLSAARMWVTAHRPWSGRTAEDRAAAAA
jgi:cytochrome c oxidase assembly protein subunit 15